VTQHGRRDKKRKGTGTAKSRETHLDRIHHEPSLLFSLTSSERTKLCRPIKGDHRVALLPWSLTTLVTQPTWRQLRSTTWREMPQRDGKLAVSVEASF
jgi:hypothetical protein